MHTIKKGCEEMKIHFFTAPFYIAFICFRVQGSRFRGEVAASPPQKEANPASLRSAAPSIGRGSCRHSLLPMEGGAPKGRRLDGGSGMQKSGKDRLKCVVYESTRAPLRGPPSPMGKAAIRGCGFSRIVKANTGYVEKKNNDGQSLPRVGKVASKASRIGY